MKWSPRRVTLPCSQLERLESSLLDDAVKKEEMAGRGGLAPHAATRGTVGLANHARTLVGLTLL